ncbi:transposase IS4 family protein [Desulfurobacterium thermolithotrophum DSM 11699]|uniref:Transposase IS4 family protein n=1 Tax=Desulfurobacterium thermolithotrophum (strain DSM 11699 / BSA) TaxID=868864 RepID=F0S168_DESTD|nr:IS5-like element ISDeth1 family transposase [Desulfurobacterium thermolithotrophum]ADY73946.1 transposase IS4 family protein [Desulfurobacterium thermolithotrophum DSM 11699]
MPKLRKKPILSGMKAKRLNFHKVLNLSKTYMNRRGQAVLVYLYPFKTKRGRPKKYPDEIILTLLFLQVAWNLSFRDLEYLAVQIFGRENIPDFSTYYYRLKQLPSILLVDFLNFVSRRLLGKYHKELRFLIIDGTGFKYNEIYPLKILRGKEIKEVKSHVKVVVLSVHLKDGKRFILTALPGESYASEVKLGEKIVRWLNERGFIWRALKGKPFLGDKAYDSIKFIELVLLVGLKPYIKVRETLRKGIKSEIRLKCKELLESDEIYRFRGLIESIFGEVKQDVGSYEKTKSFHIAQLFVLAKFILFNMGVLFFVWMIFQTLSYSDWKSYKIFL